MRLDVEVRVPSTKELKGMFNFAIINKHETVVALVGYEGDAKVMARALQDQFDYDVGLRILRLVEK